MKDVFGRAMTAAAFVMIIAMLTGCQTTEPKIITQVQVHRIEVPRSVLTCSSERMFGSVTVSVKNLMRFADQLAKAGADCRSKLHAVKKIVVGH